MRFQFCKLQQIEDEQKQQMSEEPLPTAVQFQTSKSVSKFSEVSKSYTVPDKTPREMYSDTSERLERQDSKRSSICSSNGIDHEIYVHNLEVDEQYDEKAFEVPSDMELGDGEHHHHHHYHHHLHNLEEERIREDVEKEFCDRYEKMIKDLHRKCQDLERQCKNLRKTQQRARRNSIVSKGQQRAMNTSKSNSCWSLHVCF